MTKLAAHGPGVRCLRKGPPMVHSCQCFAQRRFGGHQQRGQTLDAETGMAPVLLERGKYREIIQAEGIRSNPCTKKTVLNLASRMGFEFVARNLAHGSTPLSWLC